MQTLAFVALTFWGLCLVLPGSPFKTKPEVDWSRPNIYLAIVRELTMLMVVVWVLF